jgi:hypothetical protein
LATAFFEAVFLVGLFFAADFFTADFFAVERAAEVPPAADLRDAVLRPALPGAAFDAAFLLVGVFFAADFFAADLRVIAMRGFSCGLIDGPQPVCTPTP